MSCFENLDSGSRISRSDDLPDFGHRIPKYPVLPFKHMMHCSRKQSEKLAHLLLGPQVGRDSRLTFDGWGSQIGGISHSPTLQSPLPVVSWYPCPLRAWHTALEIIREMKYDERETVPHCSKLSIDKPAGPFATYSIVQTY